MPAPADSPRAARGPRRVFVFATVLVVGLVFAGAYVAHARRRVLDRADGVDRATAHSTWTLESIRARPHVMFLATDGDAYRRIALAPLDEPSARVVTDVECLRFHLQGGRAIALGGPHSPGGASVLGADLRPLRALTLSGVPSRARVSWDGRRAGMTFFVAGDSYLSGGFSTRSYLLDLVDVAAPPLDLEEFSLWRGGRRVEALDLNYWGITFPRDEASLYATVSTNDRRYLVRANLNSKEAIVVHDDVECPSISPDGSRVAYKRRIGSGAEIEWRLAVLDVATEAVRLVESETRNVDDQVEWLDDAHVLYALRDAGPPATLRPDVWKLAIDGASAPELFLRGAMSPVVVRP